ncbi:MAG: alpha/beta hydrolase [Clostridia bacterium]|nr:alpha/beta hydrolase [Clostridia bacterium]
MKTTAKKFLAVLLSLVMLFSVASVAVFAEDSATSTDCYYEQGEYSIHYSVVPAEGEYQGRILFIHGFLYSGTTWNGVAEIMSAEGYDCYLVDLPNYGYSTRENKNTQLIEREELMVGLMESVAPLNEWIVAGHSMGGGVALNIACDNPELQALMLYCPSETYMNGNSMMTSLATSDFMGKIMDSIFKAVLSSDLIVKLAVYMTTGDWDYAMNYDARLLADPLMIEGTGTGMLYSSVNARNTDLDAISKIEIPTLLVWADGDSVISDDIKANISGALADAETATVEGSHIVIETNAQEISALTLEFLEK